MLKLRKRGEVWYIRGTVAGVRVFESTRTADEEQAKRYLAKRQNDLYNQEQFGHRGAHTFGEALDLYLANKQQLGDTSRRNLLRLLDAFGNHYLHQIDQTTLDRYVQRRYPNASPGAVIRAVISPMTSVLRSAAKREWCNAPKFDIPKAKAYRARFLSYEEAGALIEAASPHLKPLLAFLLNTGCR
ncbi:MAG: hypothetical protein OEU92_31855, partial [Alphaproteobacteria bacterium]|nr:hypothetical protein [Alphaproteobacteria bacterium]